MLIPPLKLVANSHARACLLMLLEKPEPERYCFESSLQNLQTVRTIYKLVWVIYTKSYYYAVLYKFPSVKYAITQIGEMHSKLATIHMQINFDIWELLLHIKTTFHLELYHV